MKKATQKDSNAPFAVIETGGKQYLVSVGDVLDVELLAGELNAGDAVTFDKVLMVDDGQSTTIGMPYISGAAVKATYHGEQKGKKITIVRYKAKSNRDRKLGHRQRYARVEITAL
jgi:large subunit ribosomal protein L21